VVILPLYPQFSTTTTGSSVNEWNKLAQKYLPHINIKVICCYPQDKKFIASHVQVIKNKLEDIEDISKYKFLFSAHGLPKKIIDAGDPYQWQIEQSVSAIVDKMGYDDLDYIICYQSKVGRLEWLKPATDDIIKQCGKDRKSIVIIPIAFVSEHSETLVELDIQYKKLAGESGVPEYIRVPTLSTDELYIEMLADICKNAAGNNNNDCSSAIGERICPKKFSKCLMGE
jgi:ferrochelatase